MNMLKEFRKYFFNNSDENIKTLLMNWGIMVLIIISTTSLFPYNQWATDLLLASKLTELFGFVFPETLTLLENIYSKEAYDNVERYVAASVYGRVLTLTLVTVHFYRRWQTNITLCTQIAIKYHQKTSEYKYVKKTMIIIFFCLLICIIGFYSGFFEGTSGGIKEGIGDSLNFIDRWEITFLCVVYVYSFLKCLLFIGIVFIKNNHYLISTTK